MAENRSRILDEASRLFRAKGFDSVSVVEVMKAAGFTHGGYYGHFSSKDDLIAQSVAHALAREAGGAEDILSYLDAYLSPRHRATATMRPMGARQPVWPPTCGVKPWRRGWP